MYLSAFTQAGLPSMLNLPDCYLLGRRPHGASSHWHDAGPWVRPCHVDKPERSSSGSRHASRTSPHQALSTFVSSPSDQRQAGNHNGKTVSPFVMDYRNLMKKTAGGTPSFIFLRAIRLRVKRGLLSIMTQELLLALQPSPPGLDHGRRPGIPAAAELARGPGPEDVEH